MTIRFDGRVAIVTGAGGGLGRAYALALAERGAKVVVNDVSEANAEAAAEAIRASGGEAMAHVGSVTDAGAMEAMASRAKEAWGGVHILINNAGILRDKSFAKMSLEEWDAVIAVHLSGSANATRAVWGTMREQGYGRILMTTSSSGLYGSFGQANYSAAKLALAGFAKTLQLEGAKSGIRVNAIAPVAGTDMTRDLLQGELFDAFSPERVAPVALYLVSEDAPANMIVGAGAGFVHAAYVTMTQGVMLSDAELTPETIAARWGEIVDRTGETAPQSGVEQAQAIVARLMARS